MIDRGFQLCLYIHNLLTFLVKNTVCVEIYFQSTVKSKRDDAKEFAMCILHIRGSRVHGI